MRTIPQHVLKNSKTQTSRKWKSMKRKQVKAALRAVDDLRAGCAFFPSGTRDVEMVEEALRRIQDDLSVKKWGN